MLTCIRLLRRFGYGHLQHERETDCVHAARPLFIKKYLPTTGTGDVRLDNSVITANSNAYDSMSRRLTIEEVRGIELNCTRPT